MSMSSVQEKLSALRKMYSEQLPGKILQIEELCNALLLPECDNNIQKTVLQMVHTLKGSAASFGFTAVSSAAWALETELKELIKNYSCNEVTVKKRLEACLEALKVAYADPDKDNLDRSDTRPVKVGTTEADREKKIVFIVDDDPLLMKNLSFQISHFGYEVKGFTGLSEFLDEIKNTVPSAIIMDMMFPEGDSAGAETIAAIKETLPVIFISSRNDFDARLLSVRSGGDAYFVKPININSMIDKLDSLTTKHVIEPFRILIIDDDFELASYYSLILQQAGMTTEVVNDALNILPHISRFKPDLILMDMYMPDCNGLELARVIRQMDTYVSIPIVFLSAETNIDKQMIAMSIGGDDFLTKPIQREHLVSSVTARAGRMRIIRSLMDSDSLTGLLNHTKTKEHLDMEVERARRQNSSIAFAMIDIDKFKNINDTYGHPTGDRVIISLSRLLQQRLRKTDIIGRYGGEEFAVVLIDTKEDYAFKILDGIRDSFSQIKHHSDGVEFSASFSCGIALFPDYGDATSINNAADKALYAAKDNGRNQVVIAGR